MLNSQISLPHHFDRIRGMTPSSVNQKIDRKSSESVRSTVAAGPDAIRRRLAQLDKEWEIDRVLMLNFGVLVFAQLLAARKNRKWLWGPLLQAPLLILHATVGWCPPMLWFRPMGFRTRQEIETERESLLEGLSSQPVLQ